MYTIVQFCKPLHDTLKCIPIFRTLLYIQWLHRSTSVSVYVSVAQVNHETDAGVDLCTLVSAGFFQLATVKSALYGPDTLYVTHATRLLVSNH